LCSPRLVARPEFSRDIEVPFLPLSCFAASASYSYKPSPLPLAQPPQLKSAVHMQLLLPTPVENLVPTRIDGIFPVYSGLRASPHSASLGVSLVCVLGTTGLWRVLAAGYFAFRIHHWLIFGSGVEIGKISKMERYLGADIKSEWMLCSIEVCE
jgi:hypothetical protein